MRACDYYEEFEKPKIIYQVFQVSPCFLWDSEGHFCNNAIWIIPANDKLLLAILNSPLGWYLISKNCTKIQNGYQLIYKYLGKVPIKSPSPSDPSELSLHDSIISQVDLMLQLNREISSAVIPEIKEQLKARLEYTDCKINAMVYQLYGLSPAEINMVENFR